MTETQIRRNVLTKDDLADEMAEHFSAILDLLGEDIDREGLLETPHRVARAWLEMTEGLNQDPSIHLQKTFTTKSDAMVVVKDLNFNSVCEHHFSPFTGTATVAYIPGLAEVQEGPDPIYEIAGLSKFARLLRGYASRPQVQENLTEQIVDAIDRVLKPAGALVMVKAQHSCMSLRGVRSSGSTTVTTAVRGVFSTNEDGVKDEFYQMIRD